MLKLNTDSPLIAALVSTLELNRYRNARSLLLSLTDVEGPSSILYTGQLKVAENFYEQVIGKINEPILLDLYSRILTIAGTEAYEEFKEDLLLTDELISSQFPAKQVINYREILNTVPQYLIFILVDLLDTETINHLKTVR